MEFESPLHKYIHLVESGKVKVGKYLKKELVIRTKAKLEKYELNKEKWQEALAWITSYCRLVESDQLEKIGKPIELALWQEAFIVSMFGFYHYSEELEVDKDGVFTGNKVKHYKRLHRNITMLVASGSGKSTLLGAITVYILIGSGIYSPKAFIGSNSIEQSKLCFNYAMRMLQIHPELNHYVRYQPSRTRLNIPYNNAELRGMAGERSSKTKEGINPSILILDEIHGFKDSEYATQLKKNIKRDDSLMIEITTQGTVRGGYLDSHLEKARAVIDEEIEEDTAMYWLYEQDSLEEILEDITNAQKSNPMLGITVKPSLLEGQLFEAMNNRQSTANILTKNFNIPQNSEDDLVAHEDTLVNNYDEERLRNSYGFLGIDLAVTSDLASVVYLKQSDDPNDDNLYFKYWYFMTGKKLRERSAKEKIDYEYYIKQGDVHISDEDFISQEFLLNKVIEEVTRLNLTVLHVAIDPSKANWITTQLTNTLGKKRVSVTSNQWRKALTPLIHHLIKMLGLRKIKFNNELTSLHFQNTVIDTDKYEMLLLRKKNVVRHKDGTDATIYALKAEQLHNLYFKKGGVD